ncbi:MAG TPA: DNA-3-methyladenine glycosylase [Nitrospira sp.]|nr:DNA-3-methyladenine glycosylase [Nitrospira sp.]
MRNFPEKILSRAYFNRSTLLVARSLLGKYLVRKNGSGMMAGQIVEVEAYIGPHDLACHASKGRTLRTDVLFGPPGISYVYLIYGMYHCLNVVTEKADYPAAVLIRAVEVEGTLIDGPGKLCRAFSIDRSLNRIDMTARRHLWFEDRGMKISRAKIATLPRIGVAYAGAWADRLYRFRLRPW